MKNLTKKIEIEVTKFDNPTITIFLKIFCLNENLIKTTIEKSEFVSDLYYKVFDNLDEKGISFADCILFVNGNELNNREITIQEAGIENNMQISVHLLIKKIIINFNDKKLFLNRVCSNIKINDLLEKLSKDFEIDMNEAFIFSHNKVFDKNERLDFYLKVFFILIY